MTVTVSSSVLLFTVGRLRLDTSVTRTPDQAQATCCKYQNGDADNYRYDAICVCVCVYYHLPIPVAARSKAWVYGCSIVVIVGSNPALKAWVFVSCVCCVLSR